jgi:hypothetical protein
VLPVYYHWSFATSTEGDFGSLVQRLAARALPVEVGRRRLSVPLPDDPPSVEVLGLEGALRVPGAVPSSWADTHRDRFQHLLRQLASRMLVGDAPVVGPPTYGGIAAGVAGIPAEGAPPQWLRELNLDPRWRVVAGAGAQVVQMQQEALMTAAWAQVGEIRRVNQALCQAQVARATGQAMRQKHLVPMPAGTLLQVTRAVHRRVSLETGGARATLDLRIHESVVPDAAVSSAFRRAARPQGALGRRIGGVSPGSILEALNDGVIVVAPRKGPPGGMIAVDDVAAGLDATYDEARYGRATPTKVDASAGFIGARSITAEPTTVESPTTTDEPAMIAKSAALAAAMPPRWRDGGGESIDEGRLARLAVIRAFRGAARAHQRYVQRVVALSSVVPPPVPMLVLATVRQALLDRLDPAVTVRDRIRARVVSPEMLGGAGDPLAPLQLTLTFPQPMVEPLRALSQDYLLPGIEHVPPDTVALLESNPRFVEAFLVGANHEMSRELLWREFPADLRATFFRRFWGIHGLDEIPPINLWDPLRPLGGNSGQYGPSPWVVLLVRGELLRRYPRATIYAVPARWQGGRRVLGDGERYPVLRAGLPPDRVVLAFDLTHEEAAGSPNPEAGLPGWFLVFQEQPTEPRFGLGSDTVLGRDPAGLQLWSDLTWGYALRSTGETFVRLATSPLAGRRLPLSAGGGSATWGEQAAHMAGITLQRPTRNAVHANALLPSEIPGQHPLLVTLSPTGLAIGAPVTLRVHAEVRTSHTVVAGRVYLDGQDVGATDTGRAYVFHRLGMTGFVRVPGYPDAPLRLALALGRLVVSMSPPGPLLGTGISVTIFARNLAGETVPGTVTIHNFDAAGAPFDEQHATGAPFITTFRSGQAVYPRRVINPSGVVHASGYGDEPIPFQWSTTTYMDLVRGIGGSLL